jgi:hypothetical protein
MTLGAGVTKSNYVGLYRDIVHAKSAPCHHGVMRPHVAGGLGGLFRYGTQLLKY